MLGLAALILASASTPASNDASPAFASTAPWWEKITYTLGDNGTPHACIYETSTAAGASQSCDEDGDAIPARRSASISTSSRTKLTFERRFTPGSAPRLPGLGTGDILLGGKVMALAFDENGVVSGCNVLAASGDLTPDYGCREVRAERFEASSRRGSTQMTQGFMTILVYGHEEVLT